MDILSKKVANRGLTPFVDSDGYNSFIIPNGTRFKILLLTDFHFSCSAIGRKKDMLAQEAIIKTVEKVQPDLIIVLGDMVYPIAIISGSANNKKQSQFVSDFMEKFEIPWCFVFGNHDQEKSSITKKPQLADIYSRGKYCLFQKGNPNIDGCGNYIIKLKTEDKKDVDALVFLDSNMYIGKGFYSGFDHVHDNQIEWYKSEMKRLSVNNDMIIPSFAFMHIPIKEFYEAWQKCYLGSDEVTYHCGFVGEKDNYFGYPKTRPTHIFEDMVNLGSTKAMFFGHDHLNTISLTYKGIRLSYPMSIDYMAYIGIKKKNTQRGGTVFEVDEKGNFDITHIRSMDL